MSWQAKNGRVILCHGKQEILRHYGTAILAAAKDFVDRSEMVESFTPEQVVQLVDRACSDPAWALLLALDEQWSLVGFTVMVRTEHFVGGKCDAEVAVCYMRSGHGSIDLSNKMSEAISSIAKEWKAGHVTMVSNRKRDKAWARYGYNPVGTVYRKEVV